MVLECITAAKEEMRCSSEKSDSLSREEDRAGGWVKNRTGVCVS